MSDQVDMPAVVIKAVFDQQMQRIRAALEQVSPTQVARATGLHENTVRNIAKGRGDLPTLTTIEKLGTYLFS
jgi:plasmid maintenance system antidote protein VapI